MKSSTTVKAQTELMSVRHFQKIEFKSVEIKSLGKSFPIVWGYWESFIGGIVIPCETCICGKYDLVIVHECPNLIQEETELGEPFRYSSKHGVHAQIWQEENSKIVMEIWV
jgi:hypothetical protein